MGNSHRTPANVNYLVADLMMPVVSLATFSRLQLSLDGVVEMRDEGNSAKAFGEVAGGLAPFFARSDSSSAANSHSSC